MEKQVTETMTTAVQTPTAPATPEPTPAQLFAQELEAAEKAAAPEPETKPAAPPEKPAAKPDEKPAYNRDAILQKKAIAKANQAQREAEAKAAEITKRLEAYETAKAKILNPATTYSEKIRALRELGADIDDINAAFIRETTGKDPEKKEADPVAAQALEEVKRLKAEREEERAAAAKAAAEIEQRKKIAETYETAQKFVTDNADKYPLMAALDKSASLVDAMRELYASGEIDAEMEDDQIFTLAAQRNEESIDRELDKELPAILKIEKVRAKIEALLKADNKTKPSKTPRTLTNKDATAVRDDFDYENATPAQIKKHAEQGFLEALKQ